MHRTVHDLPALPAILRWCSGFLLLLLGWRVDEQKPPRGQFVAIAAPHTSNWDGLLMIAMIFYLRVKVYWLAKNSAFRPPLGTVLHWLGGLSVDRSRSTNLVAQAVAFFQENEDLILIIAPEGTRSQVQRWKTGFYHIANDAQVPIVLTYLDYGRKVGGVGPTILPSGDIDADMALIRDFYTGITVKHADRWDERTIMAREL